MAWKGNKKNLTDYAKTPDTGNGVVTYDKWPGATWDSGTGGASTKTDGQTKGNSEKFKERGNYPND